MRTSMRLLFQESLDEGMHVTVCLYVPVTTDCLKPVCCSGQVVENDSYLQQRGQRPAPAEPACLLTTLHYTTPGASNLKTYGGVDMQIHVFFTSALIGGEWSASRPGRFIPRERAPGTHWTGRWVGPRTGLDEAEKRQFLNLPGLELRPLRRPAHSQSLYRLSYPGLSTWSQGWFIYATYGICVSQE
jgi:hypothetical protein